MGPAGDPGGGWRSIVPSYKTGPTGFDVGKISIAPELVFSSQRWPVATLGKWEDRKLHRRLAAHRGNVACHVGWAPRQDWFVDSPDKCLSPLAVTPSNDGHLE